MNGIDPKWVFYLGILVTIESAIGQGAVKLTNVVPEAWAPFIIGWCTLLAFIGNVLMTALAGYSSKTAGPLVKPLVLLAVIVGGLFALTGEARAQAQTPRARPAINLDPLGLIPKNAPTSNDPLQNIIGAIDAKLLPDLQYAKLMADSSGSKVTGPCFGAWIDLINVRQKAVTGTDGQPLPFPDPGVISRFEQIVELRNALQPDSPFMIACSPVASMVKKDIVGFIGIVISGGAGLATLVPGL